MRLSVITKNFSLTTGLTLGLLFLALGFTRSGFADGVVQDIRVWPSPDSTRVVFDLDRPIEYSIFSLSNPDRLVIDLQGADITAKARDIQLPVERIANLRIGQPEPHTTRVVLDLSEKIDADSFTLTPNEVYGHRLVIDLLQADAVQTQGVPIATAAFAQHRKFIVAIDAGHGGEDPGAIGPNGGREKDVALRIARELAAQVNANPEMEAVLIRDGDYYIGLRDRIDKARAAQADLFVSVHADSFTDRRANGASVYTLSSNGASSEAARLLAEQENQADLVGGVSLGDKDNVLASVLLDLYQTASNEASYHVGQAVLTNLGGVTSLHKTSVQQAGFLVLKSPDIPSILVETGFISNPNGEKNLRSPNHQKQLAVAILEGIEAYFENVVPPPSMSTALLHTQVDSHTIRSGETLASISRRYGVSVGSLRSANALGSDSLRIGQVLTIPASQDG